MVEPITEPTVVPLNTALAQAVREGVAAENDQIHSALEENRNADNASDSTPDRGLEPQAEGLRQPVPQPPDDQQPFTLRDIRVGKKDGRGVPITQIYAAESGKYAIYQAGEAMVHFADDPEKEQAQRKAILPVSSARAEVNALVQGLAFREICDRQLAYALQ